ncbi:MAG: trypsin-like peptidase domain-containing protein [Cyanobacteria bacterium P01_H01_bin.150]
MINRKLSRFSGLTLCVLFNLLTLTVVEEVLSVQKDKSGYSNSAVAQTPSEQIARSVYRKATQAVVTVKDGRGHGSGFVVNRDGYIITNAHVVEGSPRVVTVEFADGRKIPADVVGFARGGLDLAVLKIHKQKNLPVLTLASDNSAQVGDRVFALGSPLDPRFKDTFTQGHITRIKKSDGEIQHDAAIFGGNSGGPLLNTKGQVIGVNTRIITSSPLKTNTGMNFSIPVSDVKRFIAAARKGDISQIPTREKPKPREFMKISLNGEVRNGKLSRENSFLDLYVFQGKAGQKVTIEMTSKNMNPALNLYQLVDNSEGNRAKKIAQNDDKGAGDFNSGISIALPADGVYVIEAKSSTGRQPGDYKLQAVVNP